MTPREGATPTPMMFRLRPRAISPTSTAIFPVPISTAPMILLLLEITFNVSLRWWNGETGRRHFREFVRRVEQLHRHLPFEGQVDGLQGGIGEGAHPVDHEIELGNLPEEVAFAAEDY